MSPRIEGLKPLFEALEQHLHEASAMAAKAASYARSGDIESALMSVHSLKRGLKDAGDVLEGIALVRGILTE